MRNNLTELQRRVHEDPDDLTQALHLALALDRKGLDAEALKQWERILELNEDMPLAWARVARLHSKTNLLTSALEEFATSFHLLLKEQGKNGSLMKRGWSLLKGRAAAFRARASSISGRFSRETKGLDLTDERLGNEDLDQEKVDIRKALDCWIKAEDLRTQGDFDQAQAKLLQCTKNLGITDWPRPVKPYEKSIEVLSAQCIWCSKAEDVVADDLQIPIVLAAGRMMLILISGSLRYRKDFQKLQQLEADPIPAILYIRGPYEAAMPLASPAPNLRFIGTLRMQKNEPFRATDRAGRVLEEVTDGLSICHWIKDFALGWAACDIAFELSRHIFEDHESGRWQQSHG
jgi:hypothetical protein